MVNQTLSIAKASSTSLLPPLSSKQLESLEKWVVIFLEENQKVNLISRKNEQSFVEQHLIHSVGLAQILSLPKNTKVLDVGTGGGLPGIALAICFPEVEFTLVDSIQKKIDSVDRMVLALGLTNVRTICGRMEQIKGTFPVVVSRAVARCAKLEEWLKEVFVYNHETYSAMYFMKGGDLTEEISEMRRHKGELISLHPLLPLDFYQTKFVVRCKPNI